MLKNLADMFRGLFGRRTRKSVAAQRRRDFFNQFRKGRVEGLEDRSLMAQLLAFDFFGESSPVTSTADVFAANLDSPSTVTRGAGAAASTASNSFRTQGFQNNGISTANTDYFQVQLSAAAGYELDLSTIDARFAGTATFAAAPGVSHQWAYSLDGTTFNLIGSPVSTTGTPATLPQVDLSGVPALQNLADGVTVTLRYYASGQTTTGGWGFNSPSAGQFGLDVGGTVSLAGSNQTPVATVPANQVANQNSPLTFSTANGNLISIADDSATVTLALSATNGNLLLSSLTGLTGTGNGTNSLSYTGTPTDLNNALHGLTYTSATLGPDTVIVSANDGTTSDTENFTVTTYSMTSLAAGDLALVHFDTGGTPTDNFAFLVLKTLNAGTRFFISDNEIGTEGATTFTDFGEAESLFVVNDGQSIPAGTVIKLPAGADETTATYTWTGSGGLGGSNEELYFYTGPVGTVPTTFIYGATIGTSSSQRPAGLTAGSTFITIPGAAARYKIAGELYSASQSLLLASIGDTANNWETLSAGTAINANDWTFTIASGPEINVQGNSLDIASGDITPSTADHTDFGSALVGGATIDRTFTIQNNGTTDITLSGTPDLVAVSGGGNFSILTQPAASTIAPGSSVSFVVRFTPTTVATQTATITIANNDSNEGTYTFDVTGIVTASVASTTTTLDTVSPGTITVGSNVTFTGTVVAGSGSALPTGTIEIRDGGASGTLLASTTTIGGTGLNGTFSISSTTVPAGSYNAIQAFYIPGPGFVASNSSVFGSGLTVNALTVGVGEVAFTAVQADSGAPNSDFFEFVALRDFAAGTTIYFIDSVFSGTAFQGNESAIRWVAQSAVTAGSKFSFASAPGGGSVASTAEWTGIDPLTGATTASAAFGLSTSGESIHALFNPTFGGSGALTGTALAAVYFGELPATLPSGLVLGDNAVSLGSFDNGQYDPTVAGSVETGSSSAVRTSINTATNWLVSEDVFGTPGTTATFTIVDAPEVNLQGNSVSIVDGDVTPSTLDHTDFGAAVQGGAAIDRTFTIQNTGSQPLTLSGGPNFVSITGGSNFSILTQPAAGTIAAGGSATFVVRMTPTTLGSQTASLSLVSNDADEATYNFDVTAIVTASAAATTTTLNTVTPLTAVAGDSVTFAGTVAAQTGTDTPVGTIEIRDGGASGTLLASTTTITGPGVTGSFSISSTSVPVGNFSNIQAFFVPGAGFQLSNSAPFSGTLAIVGALTYVNYSTAASTYSQNFDTLVQVTPATVTGDGPFHLGEAAYSSSPTVTGWYFGKWGGTGANAIFRADNGSGTSGANYSYGVAGTNPVGDRALGSLSSGSVFPRYGTVIRNNSGTNLDTITITFDGEQWRRGSGAANTLSFEYKASVAAGTESVLTTTGFVADTALNFTAPVTTGTSIALDGNAPANRTAGITKTISGISWAPGTDLILRWSDLDDTGSDDGLAIDNFTFSASSQYPNGTVTFGSPTFNVTENGTTATVTVNRVGNTTGAISVNYDTVAGGAAVAGVDYTTTTGTLNWAANDATPQSFTIPIADNLTLNANKTINLSLTNATGGAAIVGNATAVVTIRENEVAPQILLNELLVNPPTSNDRPYEFVELRGTAGATLANVYVLQLDGRTATAGSALFVSDLSAATFGSNGLLAVTAATGGHPVSPPTTQVTNAALDVTNGTSLFNDTQTMVVIFSPTPIAVGTDLDANNDGTLELPVGATLIDAVGWQDNSTVPGTPQGVVYGGVSLTNSNTDPSSAGTPDAATRLYNNSNPFDPAAWFNGDIADTGDPSTLSYDPNKASTNLPTGATLSPAFPNSGLSIFANIGSTSQSEGNSGLTPYTFTISRAGDLSAAVDVNWAVTGAGTDPAAASDFENGVFPSGLASFAINEATKQITINVAGDTSLELAERFAVTLSNPTNGATLASPTVSATIANDDYQALLPGELVLTGINTSNPDQFSFVPLVNLLPNSAINFTDNAWDGFSFGTTEGTISYTAPAGGLVAGTKVIIGINGSSVSVTGGGTASQTGSFALNGSGENLIAYVGTSLLPSFLFVVNTNNLYLTSELISTSTTYLPSTLAVGTTAVAPLASTGTIANAQYTGATTGSATSLRDLVADKNNWTTSGTALTLSTDNFTLEANTAPTINAQAMSVAESAAIGATVGTVVATDANAGQQLSYAFFDGSTTSQVSGPFTISGTTGQITVTGALDFEATPSYATTVRVTDNGSPALFSDGAVTINVSDRSEGRVFIPTTLTGSAGAAVVVPVNLQVTEVDGAAVSSVVISIAYDSAKLTFSSINLAGGPLAGFVLDTSSSTPGNLIFTATGTAGATITSGTTVTLANVTFNVAAGAAAGPTNLNLQGATNLSDAAPNLFALSPAVTNGVDTNVDGTLTIGAGPLAISGITPTATGFVASFNRAVNASLINLYDQTGGGSLGAADVTLVGTTTGAVRGSLIFNSTNTGFTFIKTGSLTSVGAGAGTLPGTLAADTYTVTLRSNTTNGFVDLEGNALRDFSGAAAGDYINTFNVAAPAVGTVTISIPDFTRGYGQAVRVPNTATNGIPVVISNGNNIGGVDFRVNFDPNLLSITNFITTVPGASALMTVVSPGVVQVTMSSGGAFATTSGALVLGEFVATVPDTAPYGSKHILSISNLEVVDASVNFDPVPAIADNGLHVAAYFGDVNGSQSYTSADTGLIQRAILGVNTGFTAFQNADPFITGDINHSLSFTSADTGFVQRQILSIAVPNIPALPVGITPPPVVTFADPKLYIPNNLDGTVDADGNAGNGIQVDIPLMLEVTEPSGITIGGFDFSFSFDTSKLTFPGSAVTPTSLNFGSLLVGAGFSGAYTIPSPGTILVTASSGSGTSLLSFGTIGSLFTVRATVSAGASGTSKLNLRGGASVISADFEELTLIPAPTNADTDPVDGAVIFSAPVNNPPVFVGSPYTFGVPENSAAGVSVGNVSANDVDAGNVLTYSLSGTGSSNFAINPNTGAITVAAGATLDFEGTASFSLTASVFDGAATVNAPVTINLSNVNEAPTIGAQTFSVPENSANGTVVGTVISNDVDAGDTKTYAITAGNTGGAFAISNTGEITVANSLALDFETTPTFTLTVSVTDGGLLSTSNTVTINLTDVFEPLAPIYINEIYLNPQGTDGGYEFIELRGTPGAVIPAGTYLVNIEGDTGASNAGDVQNIFNLAGLTFGSNGLLLLLQKDPAASPYNVSAAIIAGTTVVKNTGTGAGWGNGASSSLGHSADSGATDLENASSSFLLINTAIAPTLTDDIDADNNGTPENIYPTWTVLDSIGLLAQDPAPTNFGYAALNFMRSGGGATSTTGPVVVIGETEYVARIGNSTGSTVADWLGANTNGAAGVFALSATAAELSDGTYRGSPINHIGLPNNFTLVAPTDIALSSATIPENSATGSTIGQFTTTDPTSGDTHTYTLVSGTGSTDNAAFTLTTAGVLTINGSADFETQPSYSIRVRSTDAGSTFVEKEFVISVTNVNEAPTDIALSNVVIAENAGANAVIGTLSGTDVDVSESLTFSLPAGLDDNSLFNISGTSLRANNSFDFEAGSSYQVTIRVTDAGGLSYDEAFPIIVTNVNEAPVFDLASYVFSLAENSPATTAVGAVSATDVDAGATLTYSLSGTGSSNFEINPTTGAITVAAGAVLDFEGTSSFNLTAGVTDGTNPVSVPVTINLTNVNEGPSIGAQTFSISEQAAIGATVGTVVGSDPDAGDTLTYAITGGNIGGAFAISPAGVITIAAALDFNTTPVYSLTVSLTDAGLLSASNTVTINVTNVNSAPTIAPQTFSIPENSANGATVGTVVASDIDAGDVLTFAITGGNASGAFAISPAGVITVASSSILDLELTPSFALTVTVTDNGIPVGSSSATITINLTNVNEAPTIATQTFSVAENSANSSAVGTVLANDVDAGDTKTFAITSGNGSGAFAIDGSTGAITVANGSLLDYESLASYALTVSVTDAGLLSASNTVTINLTDVNEAPTIAPQTFTVAENAANGTAVGTVIAGDVDAGDTKTFAITGGNAAGAFAISPSGAITVANGSLLNFEATPSYSLTVSVTDGGSLSASTTVTINLTNVNEAPTVTSGSAFSVPENTTAVPTVTGNDPDTVTTLAYSIVGGVDAGKFTIDQDLGLLAFLSSPNFEIPTDAGANNVYDLIVRVSDGSLSSDQAIAVTVTNVNEAPTIANQVFSVLDTVANGHVVGTVVAADPDAGDTKNFAITAGNSSGAFAINPSSGQITVADASQLNYLVTPSYSLTVSVTDGGPLSSSATVTITVNHLNSNPTNISLSTASIPENAGVNAVVGTLSTTDPDLPSDTHTYTLLTTGTGSTDHASFNIAGNQLRANASFDFETKSSYTIRVRSTDQGGASVERVFTIFVTNVVETGNQAPSNIALSGNQTVAPTALTGMPIGNLTTSDANAGDTHTYTLGGPDAAKFFIAGAVLRLASNVTDPVGTVYNISVTSTDQGMLSFTKNFAITVAVTPNVAPTFVTLSSSTIAENNLPNALIGLFSTTDANVGDTHTYSLVSGTGSADNAAFTIPAGTNELRANTSFDFEAKTSYQIRVRSTDQGGLSVDRAITIYVSNVVETGNQAPTNIALSGLTVAPAAAPGTNVGTLTTTDPNPGNTFTYTLGGTDAAKFVINSNVLQVAPAAVIGPVGTTYSIAITSTDQGGLAFTKSFTITVATPVNVAPNGLALSVSAIVENAGPNALVGNFTTSDANASDTHTYSLVSGLGSTDNALFTIVNNQLFAVGSFDYETKTSYKIRVRTTDQGGLFYEKAFTIFITNVVGA